MSHLESGQLREELVAALAQSPLLRMLGHGGAFADELRTLLDGARLKSYEPGNNIIREGSASDGLYILVEGRLDVLKDGIQVGALTQPGEVFGEVGMLGGGVRTATVKAATHATCLKTGAGLKRKLSGDENVLFAQAMQQALSQILLKRIEGVNEEMAALRTELGRRDKKIEDLKGKNAFLEERVEGLIKEREQGFRGRRKLRKKLDD